MDHSLEINGVKSIQDSPIVEFLVSPFLTPLIKSTKTQQHNMFSDAKILMDLLVVFLTLNHMQPMSSVVLEH